LKRAVHDDSRPMLDLAVVEVEILWASSPGVLRMTAARN